MATTKFGNPANSFGVPIGILPDFDETGNFARPEVRSEQHPVTRGIARENAEVAAGFSTAVIPGYSGDSD